MPSTPASRLGSPRPADPTLASVRSASASASATSTGGTPSSSAQRSASSAPARSPATTLSATAKPGRLGPTPVVAANGLLVDGAAGVGHQLTGGGASSRRSEPTASMQHPDRGRRDPTAGPADLGAHEIGPLLVAGDLVAGHDRGAAPAQGVDHGLVAGPAGVLHHEHDPVGRVGGLLDDRVGELLADLVRGLQHDHPRLGEQRRAEAVGQHDRGELGGPEPAQLGRRVVAPDGGHDGVDRPFHQQLLLAEYEVEGGGGHGAMLAHRADTPRPVRVTRLADRLQHLGGRPVVS